MACKIAVLADYTEAFEVHPFTDAALQHAANRLGIPLDTQWIPTETLNDSTEVTLSQFDGLVIGTGSPYRNPEGVIRGIRFAREKQTPTLATCAGLQHAAIEYARHVLGVHDAVSTQYEGAAGTAVVQLLDCSLRGLILPVRLETGSLAQRIYGRAQVEERYYCRYGVTREYQRKLHDAGLRITGTDGNDGEARVMELEGHPFFIGTCFAPQSTSRQDLPHPLFLGLLTAATSQPSREGDAGSRLGGGRHGEG